MNDFDLNICLTQTGRQTDWSLLVDVWKTSESQICSFKVATGPKKTTKSGISSSRYPRARAMSSRFGALNKKKWRTPHGDWGGTKIPTHFLVEMTYFLEFWAWVTIILDGLLDRLSSHQWLDRSDGLKGVQALLFMHFFSRDSAIETYFISTFLVSHVLKPSTSLLLQGSFNGEFFRPGLAHIKI